MQQNLIRLIYNFSKIHQYHVLKRDKWKENVSSHLVVKTYMLLIVCLPLPERERESIVLQEENQVSIKFSRATGKLKFFIM